ncbi:MAG: hypothetical protein U0L49_04775 [Eubacterium sp.]|nr:hypothetical protein [Eubacterium sp.]
MSEIAVKAQNIGLNQAHRTVRVHVRKATLKERFVSYMKEAIEFYGCINGLNYGYVSADELRKFNIR